MVDPGGCNRGASHPPERAHRGAFGKQHTSRAKPRPLVADRARCFASRQRPARRWPLPSNSGHERARNRSDSARLLAFERRIRAGRDGRFPRRGGYCGAFGRALAPEPRQIDRRALARPPRTLPCAAASRAPAATRGRGARCGRSLPPGGGLEFRARGGFRNGFLPVTQIRSYPKLNGDVRNDRSEHRAGIISASDPRQHRATNANTPSMRDPAGGPCRETVRTASLHGCHGTESVRAGRRLSHRPSTVRLGGGRGARGKARTAAGRRHRSGRMGHVGGG